MLSFSPLDVLDEILNLIESVSEDFPSYSWLSKLYTNIQQAKQQAKLDYHMSMLYAYMAGGEGVRDFKMFC